MFRESREGRIKKIKNYLNSAGVFIKIEIHIFVPPPSRFIFFPQLFNMRGCGPQAKNCPPFFNFGYFKSIGGKYAYFLPIGGKICIFPSFFYPLSIIFFPQPVIRPYFCPFPPPGGGGVKQKSIHLCANQVYAVAKPIDGQAQHRRDTLEIDPDTQF